MLTNVQQGAVKMLFRLTEDKAARRLRIRQETLREWMKDAEFAQALSARLDENRRAAVRILSEMCVDICMELAELIRSGGDNAKIKIFIDVLKATGLLKEVGLGRMGSSEAEGVDYIGKLLERLEDESEDTEPGEAA
jgi:hypothetical protein